MKIRISTAVAIALLAAIPFTAMYAQATKANTKSTAAKTKTKPATKAEKPAAQATKSTKSDTKVAKANTKALKLPTKTAAKPATNPGPKNPTAIAAISKNPTAAANALDKDAKNATAECKDHTYSHTAAHQNACANHGGVLKFFR